MKRSEMIDYIHSELEEFALAYVQSIGNPTRQKHRLKSYSADILDMLLGFGMLPPPHQERRGTGYADEYGIEESHDEWV